MSDLLLLGGETGGGFYFSNIMLSKGQCKDESLVFSLMLPFPQVLGQMSASVCVSICKQQKQHGSVRGEGQSAQSEWTMAQSDGGEGGGKIKGVQVLLK